MTPEQSRIKELEVERDFYSKELKKANLDFVSAGRRAELAEAELATAKTYIRIAQTNQDLRLKAEAKCAALAELVAVKDASLKRLKGFLNDLGQDDGFAWDDESELALSKTSPAVEVAKARLRVVEAANLVKESGAGSLPDYANQKSMDKWAVGIKRIVELCTAVDALAEAEKKEEGK